MTRLLTRLFLLMPAALALVLTSSGCLKPYKVTVIQGNIITQESVDKLRTGMTKKQVIYVMGPPLTQNDLLPNQWQYVYSIDRGGQTLLHSLMTLKFAEDVLVDIQHQINQLAPAITATVPVPIPRENEKAGAPEPNAVLPDPSITQPAPPTP